MKTTMNYHLPPFRIAIVKKQEIKTVDEDVKKRESLRTVGGNGNWYSHHGK